MSPEFHFSCATCLLQERKRPDIFDKFPALSRYFVTNILVGPHKYNV